MPAPHKTYWFHAKRFGRGFGLPSHWHGWLVLLVYGALLALSRLIEVEGYRNGYVAILTLGLLIVLLMKTAPRHLLPAAQERRGHSNTSAEPVAPDQRP
jgi:hypothetical protein